MTGKCSKCIEKFREQKRRFEVIGDLKAKNEGMSHAFLKTQVCSMLRELGQTYCLKGFPTSIGTEVRINGVGKVDVVGRIGEETIAVECGNTEPRKISALRKQFDVVLHIPFCYTWDFMEINKDKILHQMSVAKLGKRLKKEKTPISEFETNKPICLEEGECSLPSGRHGYPEEAMQIAGLLPKTQINRKR